MATPYPGSLEAESGFDSKNNIEAESLYNPSTGTQDGGHIAFPGNPTVSNPGVVDPNWEYGNTTDSMRASITDYVRMRLGDGIVDVELEKEHYEMAINQALIKYRQRAQNSVEESYCHLQLMPETQEYILPKEVQTIRAIYRRGIGSVSGTTASQFEPFASGYLNTYMLVAGRVGGLVNYEMFTSYQKLAMTMFGGIINFTFNPVTKKLVIVRKMPSTGHSPLPLSSLTADGTAVGSTITIALSSAKDFSVGDTVFIGECPVTGYNGEYTIETKINNQTYTVISTQILGNTVVDNTDSFNSLLRRTKFYSTVNDEAHESVLIWMYNTKPDQMIFNDTYAFPWIQEYAYSFAKMLLGQAYSKFSQIAGPQGGASLNGSAMVQEANTEMTQLIDDLKTFVDGSQPLTWVVG